MSATHASGVSQEEMESGLPAFRWRTYEIGGIQVGAPGAAQPAEHGAATSADSVRLSEKLPEYYTGPRHAVTVRRLPPEPGAYSGEGWFEWEERPGTEPASNATGRDDEILVHVCYVEEKAKS